MATSHATPTTAEQWRDIPGYEGYYQVSNNGRVRSLDRTYIDRYGRQQKFRGKLRAQRKRPDGYKAVTLYSAKSGSSTKFVHRLVLEAFVGPCPEGMEACHWDDVKGNNHLSNLRWDSFSNNQNDMLRNGNNFHANKDKCIRGHEFTPENTYIKPSTGARECRTCRKMKRPQWNKAK